MLNQMKKDKQKKRATVQVYRNDDLVMKLNYLNEKTGLTKETELIRMAVTELYDKYKAVELQS